MGTLVKLQFKQLFGNYSKTQGTSNSKGKAKKVFIAIMFGYLILMAALVSCFLCISLLTFCEMGKGWVYFAFIGLISLAFGIIMSVFSTQNMLYGTKDNEFLLSLPIKPDNILMSRIIVLLSLNTAINLVFTIPAGIIYAVSIGFSVIGFLCFLLSIIAFPMIIQAISCVFGWFLNKLYQKFNNKAFISLIFMLLFLGIYFYIYPMLMDSLETGITLSQETINSISSWGWPLFAYGKGCEGEILYALCFLAIAFLIFALVYGVIRINYLKTLLTAKSSGKIKKKSHKFSIKSPIKSVCFKELRLFFTCPVYLTNMGLGILLIPILTVAGIIFSSDVIDFAYQFSIVNSCIANNTGVAISFAMVCAVAFLCSMTIVSSASISLEGKSLWILKSLPIKSKDVVKGKLLAHIVLVVPISMICGLVLSLFFNAGILYAVACAINCGLAGLFVGILGLIFNLLAPRFDWVNEVIPCKQAMAVMLTMFISMFYSIAIAAASVIIFFVFNPIACVITQFALFAVPITVLYFVLIKWGAKKFEVIE